MTTSDMHRRGASKVEGLAVRAAANAKHAARRARFLALADRLRRDTEGRQHTPAQDLIREDRDGGHRSDEFALAIDPPG